MKLKHFAGYGTVNATRIRDNKQTGAALHIQVKGNHECGLVRDDEYDLFNWLVKRFDKSETDYAAWHKKVRQKILNSYGRGGTCYIAGYRIKLSENGDVCDYWFYY